MLFGDNTFFTQGTKRASADLHTNFFTIDNKRLLLEVGLPDFVGAALRKADVFAELLSFVGDIASFHRV